MAWVISFIKILIHPLMIWIPFFCFDLAYNEAILICLEDLSKVFTHPYFNRTFWAWPLKDNYFQKWVEATLHKHIEPAHKIAK